MKKILILIPIIVTSFHISGMNDRSRSNSPTNSSQSGRLSPQLQSILAGVRQDVGHLEKEANRVSALNQAQGFKKVGQRSNSPVAPDRRANQKTINYYNKNAQGLNEQIAKANSLVPNVSQQAAQFKKIKLRA